MALKSIDDLPDVVIPATQIGTFIHPERRFCGLVFQDDSGSRHLLPIPGRVFADLAKDMQQAVASIHDLVNWESRLPARRE